MTAELDKNGKLTVRAHTDVERYALKAWAEKFKGKRKEASLSIETKEPETTGYGTITITSDSAISSGIIYANR